MSRLTGKVAVVTGAGRGIGRAIALKFAREGALLVINDLDREPAEEVLVALTALGCEAIAVNGDAAAPGFGERLVEATMARFGSLDILVNNAGYTWDNVIQKMDDAQWDAILAIHLSAPFRILRAAQPVFKQLAADDRAAGCRIVRKVINTSSIAGLFGSAGQANYASAKAGVIALTQTLAKEWGRYDVTVNCVAYALIATRIAADVANGETISIEGNTIAVGINSDVLARIETAIPLGRAGTPAEAAGAAFLFAIPESDYVSGQTLLCSGGYNGL